MTGRFYDVGQALSALVELPDGRRILVDTGDLPGRAGCGGPCRAWSQHLLQGLARDVPDKKLAAIWTTHQHSDHAGNAPAILQMFTVGVYVDNGTRLDEPLVKRAREAATQRGTSVSEINAEHVRSPIAPAAGVTITPIVPRPWPSDYSEPPNDCSIGLRWITAARPCCSPATQKPPKRPLSSWAVRSRCSRSGTTAATPHRRRRS